MRMRKLPGYTFRHPSLMIWSGRKLRSRRLLVERRSCLSELLSRTRQAGFNLVEFAMVLLIAGLVLGAALKAAKAIFGAFFK